VHVTFPRFSLASRTRSRTADYSLAACTIGLRIRLSRSTHIVRSEVRQWSIKSASSVRATRLISLRLIEMRGGLGPIALASYYFAFFIIYCVSIIVGSPETRFARACRKKVDSDP